MTKATNSASRRITAPQVLTFPATRRLFVRLLGPPESRRRTMAVVAGWWALSLLVLPPYVFLRSHADNIGFPVHGAGAETALFGTLPTLTLQHWLWNGSKLVEWIVVVVHASWFFVPPLMGLFVTVRRPGRFGSYIRWWIAADFLAALLFILLPTRPPWMANGEVVRIIAIRFGGQIHDSNPLAAMPSLHVALPLVLACWFARERWLRPAVAMFAYAGLIGFEVVFSGEHYVLDVIGAAAFALAIAQLSRVHFLGYAKRVIVWVKACRTFVPRLRPSGSESGQALIEFAFILPVMLVFLLVLVDFGLALDHREVIQHAEREGARQGAVGASVSAIITDTVDQSQGVLTAADVTVCYVDGPDANTTVGDAGDDVRVGVTGQDPKGYKYKFTVGSGELLSTLGLGAPSIHMNPTAEARLETPVTGATACS